ARFATYETIRKRKDGTEINVSLSAGPIKVAGETTGLFVIFRDITERKQAEEELKESEKRFQDVVANTGDWIWQVDSEGRYTYSSPAISQILGYTAEEMRGKTFYDFFHPDDREQLKIAAFKTFSKKEPFIGLVNRNVHKDGHTVILETSGVPIISSDEQLLGYRGVDRDITERRKAEEHLKESEERYRVLFENSPLNLTQHDREGRFLLPNPAMAEFVGIPLEKLAGRKMTELFPEELVQQRLEYIRKTLDEWQIQVFEDQREGRQFQVIYAPLRIPGKEDTVQVIAQDITKVKKAEEELEQAFVSLAETVSRAMAARDPYTVEHQHRVAELACLVGEKMGLEKHRLLGLYIGGLLHDIGKVSIPEGILTKPGKLVGEEWALIRAHTRQGSEILNGATFPWPIIEMTLHHHERLDGSGYPDGISGDELSPEVRILGVCDVVEAMSSTRPYRPARSKEEVLEELRNGRGTKYDAGVVDIILQIIENGEFEFEEEAK
ncbi:MAG: PAS domain S-box protein, partial [Chloroflexota bacterium]|nr:PAS domain S-box protein [Chloroflexota bacterium]